MKFTIRKKRKLTVVVVCNEENSRESVSSRSDPLGFAADELARYLSMALDAEAPVSETMPADTPSIRIAIESKSDLTDEGYELYAESADLFHIRGGGPAGVVFGVYDFLRRYAGCRFSGYAPDGEFVPRLEQIEIPAGKIIMKPELWYRGLQFSFLTEPERMIGRLDWMAKNGMNYVMIQPRQEAVSENGAVTVDPETGRVIVQGGTGCFTHTWFRENMLSEIRKRGLKVDMNHHNFLYWLPPAKYFDKHPEWYALVDGQRSCKPLQLCICTSNADAVAELIANILRYLRDNPETGVVGVIPEDGIGCCQCEECRKLDVHPDDATRKFSGHRTSDGENRSKSRRYALLLNEVARAVAVDFPQVKVGGTAYVDIQWPPRDVVLERNITVMVAPYWRCGAHELAPDACEINRFFLDILQQWRKTQPCEIILYEYYMGMNAQRGLPYPMGNVISREWPRLKEMGIGGATVQSREQDHNVYALNYLTFARIGWTAHVDYPALRDEFLVGMFGPLADTIRPIYETFDQQVRLLAENGSDSPFVRPIPPAKGCLLPNARNIAFLTEPLDMLAVISQIEAEISHVGDERALQQSLDFLDALRLWHIVAELYRAELISKKALRAILEKHARELQRIEALPIRGWMRDPAVWLKKLN